MCFRICLFLFFISAVWAERPTFIVHPIDIKAKGDKWLLSLLNDEIYNKLSQSEILRTADPKDTKLAFSQLKHKKASFLKKYNPRFYLTVTVEPSKDLKLSFLLEEFKRRKVVGTYRSKHEFKEKGFSKALGKELFTLISKSKFNVDYNPFLYSKFKSDKSCFSYYKAKFLEQSGQWKKAQVLLGRIKDLHPDLVKLSAKILKKNEVDKLPAYLDSLKEESYQELFLKGSAFEGAGMTEDAFGAYEAAVRAFPKKEKFLIDGDLREFSHKFTLGESPAKIEGMNKIFGANLSYCSQVSLCNVADGVLYPSWKKKNKVLVKDDLNHKRLWTVDFGDVLRAIVVGKSKYYCMTNSHLVVLGSKTGKVLQRVVFPRGSNFYTVNLLVNKRESLAYLIDSNGPTYSIDLKNAKARKLTRSSARHYGLYKGHLWMANSKLSRPKVKVYSLLREQENKALVTQVLSYIGKAMKTFKLDEKELSYLYSTSPGFYNYEDTRTRGLTHSWVKDPSITFKSPKCFGVVKTAEHFILSPMYISSGKVNHNNFIDIYSADGKVFQKRILFRDHIYLSQIVGTTASINTNKRHYFYNLACKIRPAFPVYKDILGKVLEFSRVDEETTKNVIYEQLNAYPYSLDSLQYVSKHVPYKDSLLFFNQIVSDKKSYLPGIEEFARNFLLKGSPILHKAILYGSQFKALIGGKVFTESRIFTSKGEKLKAPYYSFGHLRYEDKRTVSWYDRMSNFGSPLKERYLLSLRNGKISSVEVEGLVNMWQGGAGSSGLSHLKGQVKLGSLGSFDGFGVDDSVEAEKTYDKLRRLGDIDDIVVEVQKLKKGQWTKELVVVPFSWGSKTHISFVPCYFDGLRTVVSFSGKDKGKRWKRFLLIDLNKKKIIYRTSKLSYKTKKRKGGWEDVSPGSAFVTLFKNTLVLKSGKKESSTLHLIDIKRNKVLNKKLPSVRRLQSPTTSQLYFTDSKEIFELDLVKKSVSNFKAKKIVNVFRDKSKSIAFSSGYNTGLKRSDKLPAFLSVEKDVVHLLDKERDAFVPNKDLFPWLNSPIRGSSSLHKFGKYYYLFHPHPLGTEMYVLKKI